VKVWENPVIGATRYDQYTIKKVVFTEDSTVLYFHVHYPSMGGFTFGKETYIEADGKHYLITGSDAFELGQYITTDPKTWEKDFKLYFEPMPRNTKMFDIIEGHFEGAYTFFNIRPEGVKLPVGKVPAEYLADYPEEDEWPAMKYSEDPVTIHFKSLNYKPGMKTRLDLWHFDITDPSSFNQDIIYLNDNGSRTDEYRLVTSNNKCEPIIQTSNDSSNKSYTYRYNESSTLSFLTLTPSAAPSFKANAAPYIGKPTQRIILVSTLFEPVMLDIEMTEHDLNTMAYMLEGSQLRDLDNGLVTTYDDNNQIYHQSEHYTVKDAATGKPVFEVKKNKNASIDFSQTLEDKL
jgi:hypothetical protein